MRLHRAQKALYWRCRQGEQEALSALLYGIGDGVYALALAAAMDEVVAGDITISVWRQLLASLGSFHFGGYIPAKARRIAVRELRRRFGRQAARRAALTAEAWAKSDAPVKLPEELAAQIMAELPGHAVNLEQRAGKRIWAKRRALVLGVLGVAATITLGRQAQVRKLAAMTPQIKFETLQTRIVERNMVATVRDAMAALPDPMGANRPLAETYDRAGLILEEIANARDVASLENMRYIKERIDREDLAWTLEGLAQRHEGRQRQDVAELALALEEAENL